MSISGGNYSLKPLEERHAWDILSWEYPFPYDFYNTSLDNHQEHYVRQFVDPELKFHAVLDSYGTMIGFCSFGADGQVPGGNYSDEGLDIGLGMRPELTGQGNGAAFFGAILDYALSTLRPKFLRLTVAKFNLRALKLYQNFGFEVQAEFSAQVSGVPYRILVRTAVGTE
jgi:[ribosomal protein S18]-alanine N-acetyltransferase